MPTHASLIPSFAALLSAAALLAGAVPVRAQSQAQPVPTALVQAATDRAGFTLSGSLQALHQSTLAAQVGGNVLALSVSAGDRVRAGQPIARLDDRDVRAGLAAAEAGVAQAEAQRANAKAQVERSRELSRQGFISGAALDGAEAQWRAAQAGHAQAQAMQAQAALARAHATITAPFDAVVLATHVEAGDLAAPGRPLVTLYVPGRLRAVVQVPSSRSAAARAATAVEVLLPDGRALVPSARQELPVADAVAQTVEWRFELPESAAAGLAPGQAVQVRFAGAGPAAALPAPPRLPVGAVLQRGELSAVYVVQDGRFVLRPVRLGAEQGGTVEVLAGLRPGERFAVDGVRAGLAGARPAP